MNNQNLRPIDEKKRGSGGPRPGSGRKPLAATVLKEKLGDYAGDALKAFKFCSELMNDATAEKNVRLAAAREVMDRLWGKSTQQVEHSGKDGGPLAVQVINYAR